MEQRTKLAAVYLGMCLIFVAFAGVSSIRANNPKDIIRHISKLLGTLHDQLTNLTDTLLLKGLSKYNWENHIECAGTFLYVFENGTREISGHFSENAKVYGTSENTLNCIEKLRGEKGCEKLKLTDPACDQYIQGQKALYFVKMFHEFSSKKLRQICKTSTQEPDLPEDIDIPIC